MTFDNETYYLGVAALFSFVVVIVLVALVGAFAGGVYNLFFAKRAPPLPAELRQALEKEYATYIHKCKALEDVFEMGEENTLGCAATK